MSHEQSDFIGARARGFSQQANLHHLEQPLNGLRYRPVSVEQLAMQLRQVSCLAARRQAFV